MYKRFYCSKKIFSIFALACFFFISHAAHGQEAAGRQEGKALGNKYDIKNYKPFVTNSSLFKISQLHFARRFSFEGIGEFLDVVFYLDNLTTDPIELYAFVVAYYEVSNVDHNYRRWFPYPVWRKKDWGLEHFFISHAAFVPKHIPQASVWDEKDSDYIYYQRLRAIRSARFSNTKPLPKFHPPLWKYLEYMSAKPKEGLAFKLHGHFAPLPKDTLQVGFAPPDPGHSLLKEERIRYTLAHEPRRTIFRSHHFGQFRIDRSLFNRVAIVFFDAKEVERAETQGKKSFVPAFKKIYAINIPFER